MKKLLLFIFLPMALHGQNTIGLPDVINYSKQVYSAGLQNWDIKQDKNGIIYIANNEGLLSFDGKYWNTYPLPNKTIVRAVEIGADKKIYVGGQDEIGYFAPASNGQLKYHSLTDLLSAKDKKFGDVWDIVSINKDIFFRSSNKIYKLSGGNFAVFTATNEWTYLGLCNGKIYAHDYSTGLLQYENNIWSPVFLQNLLPKNDPVTGILPLQKDSILITTLKNGCFIFSKSGISKFLIENNDFFENARIYAATKINSESFALATNNGGAYVIGINGNIIQSFTKTEGLQNNNILSIYIDNLSNIWLGLDNGIDLITYNSALKHINPLLQGGSGYAAMIYNSRLYIGTSNGLQSVALQDSKDLSFCKGNFSAVDNIGGQTWGLSVVNNQLLIGHHEGAFLLNGNSATNIIPNNGFWNFVPLSNTYPVAKIIAGNYRGVSIFDFKNGTFAPSSENIDGFNESSRFIALDQDSNIWVSHPYHGIYKIAKNNSGQYSTISYTDNQGLPSILNNHIYNVKNQVVAATEKGIYIYNNQKDRFEPSPYYTKILGNQSIRYIKEDASGNIWFIHEKKIGVIDFSGKEPSIIYLPELNNKMLSGFEFIYPVNENNIFLGSESGFIHINFEKYKQTLPQLNVQIRSVRIIDQSDSILFGGYFKDINENQIQETKDIFKVGNKWKTIRFEFATPVFGNHTNFEYSYRLTGFSNIWSEWTSRTEKEFTNLPPGNYTFEVKVRSNAGNESKIAAYIFSVLPKWYETIFARFIYFLLFVITVISLYRWQQKKFKLQQKRYEEEQKKLQYIHELELNKTEAELIVLRNEKLESEINFKNSELASSAMHLVKKGELLSKIKGELAHIMKGMENQKTASELKKMIKTVSEDDNVDKEWDNFAKHFDKVHSDFVVELKEKHPSITPNELKLSAYLRMNLSTKEIAQLMNISTRGVEISRYRLRKKLQISTETSLFDYLINIQPKA
jgi:ligand-binding sensor domain-containing protein/DNA-binding CsgD family transcriptional regulator